MEKVLQKIKEKEIRRREKVEALIRNNLDKQIAGIRKRINSDSGCRFVLNLQSLLKGIEDIYEGNSPAKKGHWIKKDGYYDCENIFKIISPILEEEGFSGKYVKNEKFSGRGTCVIKRKKTQITI